MVLARRREELGDLILVQQVKESHHLLAVLGEPLDRVVKKVGLVIVDSVAALMRYDGEFTTLPRRGECSYHLEYIFLAIYVSHFPFLYFK